MKWTYTDNAEEFNCLGEGQFYNHFRNSRELTSKNGLLSNFKNCGLDSSFFPRAFDLGNASEREDFLIEYERTTYYIVLKKHIMYFKKRRPKLVQTLRKELLTEYTAKQHKRAIEAKRLILSRELHRKFKHIYKPENFVNSNDEKDFRVNIPLLCEAVSRYSDWKHMMTNFIEEADNPPK